MFKEYPEGYRGHWLFWRIVGLFNWKHFGRSHTRPETCPWCGWGGFIEWEHGPWTWRQCHRCRHTRKMRFRWFEGIFINGRYHEFKQNAGSD